MSWDEPICRGRTSNSRLSRLRRTLDEHDYSESAIAALLGIETPSTRSSVRREVLIGRVRHEKGPLPVLVRLFFLGDVVSRTELGQAFSGDVLDGLLDLGLFPARRRPSGALRAQIGITPCGGVLVVSDSLALDPAAVYGPGGPTMGPGPDTETLVRTTPRGPLRRVLDLCTGPGTHALIAARHSQEVTGVDIAPRAVCFARAGARLNGARNVRFVIGDVTAGGGDDSVPAGPYDLVLANPPFVPTPPRGLLYRDGGALGDEALNAVLGRLESLLAAGGQARLIADVAFRAGESLEAKLRHALGVAFERFDIACFEASAHELESYAEFHSLRLVDGRMRQEPAFARELRAYHRRMGILRIAPVLLALRRSPLPGRRLFRRVDDVLRLGAGDIDRVLRLWTMLGRGAPEAAALATRPTPKDGVSLAGLRFPGASGPVALQMSPGEGLPGPAAAAGSDLFEVLSLCDGLRTGAAVASAVAKRRGCPVALARPVVARALVSLAELGAVEIAGLPE